MSDYIQTEQRLASILDPIRSGELRESPRPREPREFQNRIQPHGGADGGRMEEDLARISIILCQSVLRTKL